MVCLSDTLTEDSQKTDLYFTLDSSGKSSCKIWGTVQLLKASMRLQLHIHSVRVPLIQLEGILCTRMQCLVYKWNIYPNIALIFLIIKVSSFFKEIHFYTYTVGITILEKSSIKLYRAFELYHLKKPKLFNVRKLNLQASLHISAFFFFFFLLR